MRIEARPLRRPGDSVVSPNGRPGYVIEVCPVIRDIRVRFDDDHSSAWFYSPEFLLLQR